MPVAMIRGRTSFVIFILGTWCKYYEIMKPASVHAELVYINTFSLYSNTTLEQQLFNTACLCKFKSQTGERNISG
jgi:hypothetical protein